MKSFVVPCPTCQKSVTWGKESPQRPFCSERCKLIDLGAWANDEHKIAGTTPVTASNHDEDDPANDS